MPRARCNQCQNPLVSCICKWISPVFNNTAIVILQHPDEVKKPLGTAKIVSLSLQNAIIKVGVDFSTDTQLHSLIDSPERDLAILYPSDSALDLQDWCKKSESNNADNATPNGNKTLVVLDGTWRNTREIMNVNPALKTIPTVKLAPLNQSNYRIRKAPFAGSLATVEAISQALNILEPETPVDSMNRCFENMIDYQISRMGPDVYQSNYSEPSDSAG
ncbi:tRNA-uridine aminocarboxypropyltransferase [Alkalimarinus sediminis]|uniref:tRNA-uridine aminocarboxypropyltransferase n=1 Tax=Alkalimarinus sediminis TaxID=1632866 RepID=A0A9E8HM48_9ALTE|nr:tRNA-uridine aminocarboxypropyltransferase [Alkalimarinus sediminis]UZW75867.1 DTW domain-containing protein [Alkalimarinus sediminis]